MRDVKFRAWDGSEFTHMDYAGSGGHGIWACGSFKDVQQYTGLTDKNGREIYEGDIVKQYGYGSMPNPAFVHNLVEFTEGAFTHSVDRREYGVEVIGNIHEHPELLSF